MISNDDHQSPGWRDVSLSAAERVADLIPRMRLAEKVAQLQSVWIGATGGDEVAPHQHEFAADPADFATLITSGLGQLTRPFGTAAIEPNRGVAALARMQAEIVAAGRFGIPALAHEECLSGFMTAGATVYPTPLACAATFDPGLVNRMGDQIGQSLRAVGVHQGLGPVLDVTVDSRWGRTEETLGEDPYLVATLGTAYARGLHDRGVIATLKHFIGYSASRDARNFGPVSAGPRELSDVFLLPFEMAIQHGVADSVMHSYVEIDGVPAAASAQLLTDLLRDTWQFDGTVVSDYFGIAFLHTSHRIAAGPGEAAAAALAAGVDVELPSADCYGEPLRAAVANGTIPESLVDRALERVLRQKCELGLLDPQWSPGGTDDTGGTDGPVDLDPESHRRLARRVAEESVILLSNHHDTLPLNPTSRLAVVGPVADASEAMLGCYTFPNHVGDSPDNVAVPTLLESLRRELPDTVIEHATGCGVSDMDEAGIADAVAAATRAQVCVAVLGDRSGLFGRGTSGEGCDREDHALPGVQAKLLHALLETATPVIVVLLTGRPYALDTAADRAAAIVQAFFPGEEGGPAVAAVLSGRVNPSGRLPVSVPARPAAPAPRYLNRPLGHRSEVSNIDPSARFAFGHGLSYTEFTWDEPVMESAAVAPTDGGYAVSIRVRNTGARAGTEVVQLYLHDPVAQVTQPVRRLIGYSRVDLEPGQARRVRFGVSADLAAFTGLNGTHVVEPGDLRLHLAASSRDIRHTFDVSLVGDERIVDHRRRLTSDVELL